MRARAFRSVHIPRKTEDETDRAARGRKALEFLRLSGEFRPADGEDGGRDPPLGVAGRNADGFLPKIEAQKRAARPERRNRLFKFARHSGRVWRRRPLLESSRPLRRQMILLTLLFVAGCSRGDAPASAVDVDAEVTIEQRRGAPWRVGVALKQPTAALDLGPTIDGYRARHWRIETPGVRLSTRGGRDYLETGAARKFSQVDIRVDPAPVDLHKDYEPFIALGDGAVIFYSGHFTPFRDASTRLHAKLTIAAAAGAQVYAFGERAPTLADWESPYDHPAFIYVGAATPQESETLVTISDATAPSWISDEIATLAPAIGGALRGLFARSLPTKPTIFVAMGDLGEEGRLSYSGDALPGQYQMTLAGGAWRDSSPQALAVLRRTTAHEAAHLWQAASRPARDSVPNWIHEGGADALAAEAMAAAGYWTPAEKAADFDRARRDCAAGLERQSLQKAEAEARWTAVYACGHVLNIAAAGDGGVASLWRELVSRAGADGYDEATFLALAEERAGAGPAQAMRDLIRINDARPELAIARMLGEAPDLAADEGR